MLELVPLGSMLRYLLDSPNLVSPTYELVIWASQIARGSYTLLPTKRSKLEKWKNQNAQVGNAEFLLAHTISY